MGCGASMLDAPTVKKVRATRINPRLHRRIEDLKRRRHARSLKKITPSKKELLRHRSNEDVGEIICHFNPLFEEMQKSTHSREDMESCVTSEESKHPSEKVESLTAKVDERLMQNVPFEGTFESNVGDEGVEKVKKDQIANAEDEDGDGDGDDVDGMGEDREDERRIGYNAGGFPGSPSFRIYYVENMDNDKNESDNENQQLEKSTYSVQNVVPSEEAVSLKDAMTMTMPEKKGRKRSGFAKAVKGRKLRCY